MKKYRIVVTTDAENDLRKYISYLKNVKKNQQAVKNVLKDFKDTKKCLASIAGSIKEPESYELKNRGLKRLNFLVHNYFLLYYIDNETVYITQIFHGLENFESKLR